MKYGILLIALALLAAALAFCMNDDTSSADSGDVGENIHWEYDTGTRTLTVTGTGAIPDYGKDDNLSPWRGLSPSATTLVIGDGITAVGAYSFYNTDLVTVTFADSVETIGDYAFHNSIRLETLDAGDGFADIGERAFYNSSLTAFGFGDHVSHIGTYAFASSKLAALTAVGSENAVIDDHAFDNCRALIDISLGEGFITIGEYAFTNCGRGTVEPITVSLGPDLVTISDYAFQSTHMNTIIIPDKVTTIGASAFSNSELKSVTLGEGLTTIGRYAFSTGNSISTLNLNSVRLGDFTSNNGTFKWDTEAAEVTVTIGSGVEYIPARIFENLATLKTVTVPDSVTAIGERAFYACRGLNSITMSDALVTIGPSAFNGCTGLTALTIPETLTSLGKSAFYGCSGLGSVQYDAAEITGDPSDQEYPFSASGKEETGMAITFGANVRVIPQSIFGYSNAGPAVTIPEGITSIGANAFNGCEHLTAVTIPSTVTAIGNYAFYGCTNLTTVNYNASEVGSIYYVFTNCGTEGPGMTVNFGATVTTIPYGIFDKISAVKNVTIAEGVKKISGSAVSSTGIQSITIPSTVTSIDSSAFYGNTSLTEIIFNAVNCNIVGSKTPFECTEYTSNSTAVIGEGVTTVPSRLFQGMSKLTSVTIGPDVTTISDYAFMNCTGLTSITIPAKVTNIYNYAFMNCTGITEMTYNATNCRLYDNALYNFGSDNGFSAVFGEGITEIPDRILEDNSRLKSVSLPSTLETIGRYAFSGTGITGTLTIPDKVATIDECAFKGIGITSLTLGKAVKTLGYNCFKNCADLELITIDSVALNDTRSPLEGEGTSFRVTINDSVTNLAKLFYSNARLTGAVVIPDSVTTIAEEEFYGCSGITSLTTGNGVTSIGTRAFYGCSGITSLTIGTAVETIGSYSFVNMYALAEINYNAVNAVFQGNSTVFPSLADNAVLTLGDGVTSLAYRMFDGVTALKTVVFDDSLVSIPAYAFNGTSIQEAVLPDGLTSIASSAFGTCEKLTRITIPSSVTNLASDAFGLLRFYDWDGSMIGSVGPSTVAGYQFSMADSKMTKEKHGFGFEMNGAAEKPILLGIVGKPVTVEDPEYGHYSFDGWYSDEELTVPYNITVFPEGFITLYTKWTPDTYTVIFDPDGGTGEFPTVHVTYPDKVAKPADPVKAGYDFLGWKLDDAYYVFEDSVLGDMELVAQWEPKKYIIPLARNGGDADGRAIVAYMGGITNFDTVTRYGYDLDGFFTAETDGTMIITAAGELVASVAEYTDGTGKWIRTQEDCRLYAQWTAKTSDLTLEANGGESGGSAVATFESSEITGLVNASRKGYDLQGYFSLATDGIKVIDSDGKLCKGIAGYTDTDGRWLPITDTTLYARWTPKVIELVLNGNGAEGDGSATVTYDSPDVTGYKGVEVFGYTLDGYFTAADAGTELIDKDGKLKLGVAGYTEGDKWSSETGIALYAHWTPISCEIILDKNGGSDNGNAIATYDDGLSSIKDAMYVGHTLTGYFADEACTVKVADADGTLATSVDGYTKEGKWIRTDAVRLFAGWEADTYTVTLNVNGGKELTPNTKEIVYGTAYELATPEHATLFFAGWMDAESNIVPLTGTWNIASDITLTAQWKELQTFEVKFTGGEGTTGTVSSMYVTEGNKIEMPANGFGKEGHEFVDWLCNGTHYAEGAEFTVNANTEFTATWNALSYTVRYYVDEVQLDGTYAETEHVFGTSVDVLAAYTKTGYDVTAWTTTDVAVADGKFTMPAHTVTLKATTSPAVYTVTLDRNGGSNSGSAKVTYDTAGPAAGFSPADYTGYDVIGYYTAAADGVKVLNADGSFVSGVDGYTSEDGKWTKAGDTTLYAHWQIQVHTLTIHYVYGDSSEAAADYTAELEYNTPFSVDSPAITGYSPSIETVTGTMGTVDDVTTVVYTVNKYTITFDSNGGSTVDAKTQDYSTTVTAPDEPERGGYAFVEWRLDGTKYEFTTMPAEDITLVAAWEIVTYTVTYNLDGGTNADGNIAEFNVETDAFTLLAPSKTGHRFDGWFDNEGLTGDAVKTVAGGTVGNVVLYASWTVNQYTITFDSNGGSAVDAKTQDYGSAVSAPADPTKEGYAFVEWRLDGEKYTFSTMPAENITLVAAWEIVTYTVTYNLDGGTNADGNIAEFTVETEAFTLLAPSKTGYRFNGWFDNEGLTGDAITTIAGGATGDATLYASWTVTQYTITFDSNGGSAVTSITEDYGAAVSAPTAPTKDGYAFKAWQLNGTDYEFTTMPAENITLTALWAVVPASPSAEVIEFSDDTETVTIDKTVSEVTDALDDASKTEVDVKGSGWAMEIPKSVVQNASGNVSATAKALSASDISALPSEVQELIRGKPVFSLSLSDGNGSVSFSGSPVKVSLAYTLKDGEDADDLRLYYINASNEAVEVDATYENGSIVFTTDHFSVWFADFEDSGSNGGGFPIWIVAVVIVVALLAALFVLMKMGIIPDFTKKL